MDESKTSVKFSGPLINTIPEETWDKVARDVCRGFQKYNLADAVPWDMQPTEGKQAFVGFLKDLAERLYRSDVGTDASRLAHEASRDMMAKGGWKPGIWDEMNKLHPDMTNWSEVMDATRIKYALMVLILSCALKYHGHPVLIHLLP